MNPFNALQGVGRVVGFLVVALVVVAFFCGVASAAVTVPGSLRVDYTLPTQGCLIVNGTTTNPCQPMALTGADALTGAEVYISADPTPPTANATPTGAVGAGVTTINQTVTVPNDTLLYIWVRVKNSTKAGDWANGVTKLVHVDVGVDPGVPTNVTVTLAITLH